MSHVLEEYAKNLGVLISKPTVCEHFFPIPEGKYITIFLEERIPSKMYKNFDLVINLIHPFLKEKDIKIIQIDRGGQSINGVDKVLGGLSFKQYANVLSGSLLHIGVDNVYSHYASSKNIPLVTLFGNTYPSISNGYWSKNDKKKDIAAPWDVKPCLNLQDPKSEINKIKPEIVSQAILDLLKIPKKLLFKTISIGKLFDTQITEVVPISFSPIPLKEGEILFLRTDKGYDQEAFIKYCQNYKVSIIANKLIQPSHLEKIKENIKKISVFIDKDFGEIPDKYFEILKIWGIEFEIFTQKEEDLPPLRNKYFDQVVSFYETKIKKPEDVSDKCFFLSNKRVFADGVEYPSLAHWKCGLKSVDISMEILHTPEYWEEQAHFYFYEQS
jgi:hypothetical protein